MKTNVPRFTVGQISQYIGNLFAGDFVLRAVCVEGEISNLKYHSSGHIYFTLKDEAATLNAVMFASSRSGLRFTLKDGMKVLATGQISLYAKGGSYQLYARSIEQSGVGDLYRIFQERKARLEEMGLFDPMYKKAIPPYALRIGVVTAPTGAAIQDIRNITFRRNPYVQLILYPALVQGEYAAASIVRGIETLDKMGLDTLIIGRGGGSLEDLWAFNEEEVVKAVFNAKTPIISAVGHETDTTLADYAADLRAPTPSAGAELAVFDLREYRTRIGKSEEQLRRLVRLELHRSRARLSEAAARLSRQEPHGRLRALRLQSAGAQDRLKALLQQDLHRAGQRLERSSTRLKTAMTAARTRTNARLAADSARLDALSPLKRLAGGYAYAQDGRGHTVRSVKAVRIGDPLQLFVADGRLDTVIRDAVEIERNEAK